MSSCAMYEWVYKRVDLAVKNNTFLPYDSAVLQECGIPTFSATHLAVKIDSD